MRFIVGILFGILSFFNAMAVVEPALKGFFKCREHGSFDVLYRWCFQRDFGAIGQCEFISDCNHYTFRDFCLLAWDSGVQDSRVFALVYFFVFRPEGLFGSFDVETACVKEALEELGKIKSVSKEVLVEDCVKVYEYFIQISGRVISVDLPDVSDQASCMAFKSKMIEERIGLVDFNGNNKFYNPQFDRFLKQVRLLTDLHG